MLEQHSVIENFRLKFQTDCNLICDELETLNSGGWYIGATLLEELNRIKGNINILKGLQQCNLVQKQTAYQMLDQVKQAIHNESLQAYKENYTAILYVCNEIEQIIDEYFGG